MLNSMIINNLNSKPENPFVARQEGVIINAIHSQAFLFGGNNMSIKYDKDLNKLCPHCKKYRPIKYFYKDKSRTDGLCSWCKECCKIHSRKYKRTEIGKLNERIKYKKFREEIKTNPEVLNKYRKNQRRHRRKYSKTAAGKYWNLKGRAKDIKFTITQHEFELWFEKQTMKCHYCKKDVLFGYGKGNLSNSLTIDRKDNQVGYTIDNIVFACRKCNTIKGMWFTEKEMLEIAERYFNNE